MKTFLENRRVFIVQAESLPSQSEHTEQPKSSISEQSTVCEAKIGKCQSTISHIQCAMNAEKICSTAESHLFMAKDNRKNALAKACLGSGVISKLLAKHEKSEKFSKSLSSMFS